MNILFGINNSIGSNIMLSRILDNISSNHNIKTIAYYKNHQYLKSIDWILDTLYQNIVVGTSNYFKEKHGISGPYVNHNYTDLIINELIEWEPDLVISDCEYFTAVIAKIFNIPLWYCSPLLQLTGILHDRKTLNSKIFNKLKSKIESLPEGDKYLIYSPLCDISSRPILNNGFEWVKPYFNKPKEMTTEDIDLSIIKKCIEPNFLVTTGETSFVSDCIYAERNFFTSPNPLLYEQILNAQLCQWYNIAGNIGRTKNIQFIKDQVEKFNFSPILSIQQWKTLHERIDEI